MPSNKLKEIAAYRAKIAALEKAVAEEQQKKLAGLHKEAGFDSTEELIDALKGLVKPTRKSRGRAAGKAGRASRTRITPAIKAGVGQAVEAGKKGAEIAMQFGISIPSIQNIKKELGLVKTRGAKASPKKIAKKTTKKKAAKKRAMK